MNFIVIKQWAVLPAVMVMTTVGLIGVAQAAPAKKPLPVLTGNVFVLPSGNIHCMVNDFGDSGFEGIRCDIHTPMKPTPKGTCELDWTGAYLPNTGKAEVSCAGDTVAGPDYPVLKYGQKWMRQDITCSSSTKGLTCTNQGKHGFFLSRESWKAY